MSTFRAMVITFELSMCKSPSCVSSILTLLLSIPVYIPAYRFPRRSHGFGMLIEDEVLIGAEYSVVLGASAPQRGLSPPTLHSAWLTTRLTVVEAHKYFHDKEDQGSAALG